MPSRSDYALQAFGQDTFNNIQNVWFFFFFLTPFIQFITNTLQARVLMVGAGGIGCELLKDLVLLGLSEIHIVDLDTIDLSNLNRQFLFRHRHIKQPKSFVAAETASKFNPAIKIVPYFSNIKDTTLFPLSWFKSFDIVLNALDNKDARSYVNRMCLTANVPLVESGTSGFRGQTQPIVGGLSECFECNPKETPKTFAICTIRSTPSQPIHCIVWAKNYLFSQLFDEQNENEPVASDEDAENAEEIAKLQKESNELKAIRDQINSPDFAKVFFDKCFTSDIERLASMDTMWKTRKAPKPLSFAELSQQAGDYKTLATAALLNDQKSWSAVEAFAVLLDSTDRLQKRYTDATPLSFDKDDEDTLDFVSAAAVLRSLIFSIEVKSKFEIKQMAGNIIPAIATTNAIVSGLSVLQSVKLLNGLKQGTLKDALDQTPTVFLSREPTHIFSTEKNYGPRPECAVCSVTRSTLLVNPEVTTLRQIVETLLQENWSFSEEFAIVTDGLIYDPDFDDNLDRTLADLGINSESFITVHDESDETPHANLELLILKPEGVQTSQEITELLANMEKSEFKAKYIPPPPESDDDESDIELADDDLDDDVVILEEDDEAAAQKRKLEDLGDLTPKEEVKRLKVTD